jgi:hypothetical protein
MKTGRDFNETQINFKYVMIAALDAILKRDSLKDMLLFRAHNAELNMSPELFCHSVCFNLFSEHGVGKMLEPLFIDVLHSENNMSEKYLDDIFYKEIATLSPEIVSIIREDKSIFHWTYEYASQMVFRKDDIAKERFSRLFSLVDFDIDEIENFQKECQCKFCIEFEKFCYPKTQTVEEIIKNLIKDMLSK